MGKIPPRVYLSSSSEDLKLHRRAARDQLEKLGFDVVAMEAYSAEEGRSLERCLRDVRSSDLYVGIFAWRYGSIAPGHEQSFTELEYREAGQLHVERLVFLLHPDEPWPPTRMDSHVGGDDGAIRRLRDELEQTHLCAYFTTPESLVNELSPAVQKFHERRAADAGASARGEAPSDSAIQEHVRSVFAELGPSFESYYVSLRATVEGHNMALEAGGVQRGLRPPSFDVVDRHLSGSSSAAEQLEVAEVAVDRFTQFVALGEPGGGKTTFLHSLELKACRRLLSDPKAPVPLFIRLTQWPEGVSDFGSLIVHERTVRALQSVPTRRLLLLLDELNELDEDLYELRLDAIARWTLANPSVSIVIASRRQHYETGPKLPMPFVVLHPLDDRRVESFIRLYLGESADALLSTLIWEPKGVMAARTVSHLARNPYLLRLLCYVYERTGQSPPPSRGKLIQLLVESLWDREHRKGSAGNLPFHTFIRCCSDLAIAMICRGASTSVHIDFAVKHLPVQPPVDRLLKLMQDASLVRTSKNGRFVQFTHQMLLEYFGAESLHANPQMIEKVVPRPQITNGIRTSRPIDEVLLILLDLASPATVLLPIVRKDPYLAAELIAAISESTKIDAALQRRLVDTLTYALESKTDRGAAVHSLSRLGEPGIHALRSLLTHEHKWVRRSAVEALGRIGSRDAVEAVIQALGDSDRWVRREAAAALTGMVVEGRAYLEGYLLDGFRQLPAKARRRIGRELLAIFGPAEMKMRELTIEASGIQEEALPAHSSSIVPDSMQAQKVAADIARCAEALEEKANASLVHHDLVELFKVPSLPDSLRESLCEVGIRWLAANLSNGKFSSFLDGLLQASKPGRREREELLNLMARKWRAIRPGAHGASARNRILLQLLGMPGEVDREAVENLTDSLLQCMRSEFRRDIVSAAVLRRLKADLLADSIRSRQLEDAVRIATERILNRDPGFIPSATAEVTSLISDCVAVCQSMLQAESLSLQGLRSLVDTLETLVGSGHLYRCRHLVARLMALVSRCSDEDLKTRVFAFGAQAASDHVLTQNQRSLFAEACYRVADHCRWGTTEAPHDVLLSLGLERLHEEPSGLDE